MAKALKQQHHEFKEQQGVGLGNRMGPDPGGPKKIALYTKPNGTIAGFQAEEWQNTIYLFTRIPLATVLRIDFKDAKLEARRPVRKQTHNPGKRSGFLALGNNGGNGEWWFNSRHNFKTRPTGFADRLYTGCNKCQEWLRFLVWASEENNCHLLRKGWPGEGKAGCRSFSETWACCSLSPFFPPSYIKFTGMSWEPRDDRVCHYPSINTRRPPRALPFHSLYPILLS